MTREPPHSKETPQILQEQADPPLSRIMSMDRGPFKDEMYGDPFEYEILGDPCADPEKVTFKVFKFSRKARPGYMKRHKRKLGKRVLEKGRFIFPKTSKYRKLGLAGKDSWQILRDKLGGAEVICDRVKEAEKKEKKPEEKPADADTGGRTPEAGAEVAADTGEKKKSEKKAAVSGPLPGSLKYWILNGNTGLEDYPLDVGSSEAAKSTLKGATEELLSSRTSQPFYYNPATLGYALYSLVGSNGRLDVPGGIGGSLYPSIALNAAMKLIKTKRLNPDYNGALTDLMNKKRRSMSDEEKKIAGAPATKKVPNYPEMAQFAQVNSDKLATYLGMPFFGKVSAAVPAKPKPAKEKKPPAEEKKPDKKPASKLEIPQGNLMNKSFKLGGFQMKVTANSLSLNGNAYKATAPNPISSRLPDVGLKFYEAEGVPKGVRLKAGAAGISDEGLIPTKDLLRYAQQLSSKGRVVIRPEGADADITLSRAKISEVHRITPQQLNRIVLNELKSIGFIKEPQESTMKITAGKLRQIIREELGRKEVSAEDLVILNIPAPKDAKGEVDEEEAQKQAVEIVMGSEHDQVDAFFIYKGEMYFFASADDMRSWQQMTKEDRIDKPAPVSSQELGDPYMSREEFREKAKKHNWTYEYSSGDRYYKGKDEAAILRRAYEDFKARGWEPPAWQEIRLWSYGNIIEDLQQDEEGNLYHSGSPQRPAYKLSKDSTISREDWNKIDQWFSK